MSGRDVGSPGVQGAGPRASQVRVKRRGDNHKVAMLTMVRPAPGHCPVRSSPLGMLSEGGGSEGDVEEERPWSQGPG